MNNIYSGNINIPLTPFVFDKIYVNVPSVNDLLLNDDDVYIGRYVLEKRDENGKYNRVFQKQYINNQPCYILIANYDAPEETLSWQIF